MSFPVIILLLFVPMLGGWLLSSLFISTVFKPYTPKKIAGFKIQNLFTRKRYAITRIIIQGLKENVLQNENFLSILKNESTLRKIKPAIELQVDIFLKEKLKISFPMMHQLMGEKTMGKFKAVFLDEVDVLFPVLLQKYATIMMDGGVIEQEIKKKLDNFTIQEIEAFFIKIAGRQLFFIKLISAFAGLVIGFIQILIVSLL